MLDLDILDPGIRCTVAWLRSHGFRTTNSGDGKTRLVADPTEECALPFAYVAMAVEPGELVQQCQRIAALLGGRGIRLVPQGRGIPTLGGSYDPADGSAILLLDGVDDALLFRPDGASTDFA